MLSETSSEISSASVSASNRRFETRLSGGETHAAGVPVTMTGWPSQKQNSLVFWRSAGSSIMR